MDKGDSKKNKKSGREIKQIFLSEDGNEEKTVTSKVIEHSEKTTHDKDEHEHKAVSKHSHVQPSRHEELSSGTKAVRIIAIAVAMVFSLVLAMAVGVGLALWDSNRTMADLREAFGAQEVAAATTQEAVADDAAEKKEDEVSAADDSLDDVPGGDEEQFDYGSTISEDDGQGSVSKAGKSDEITAGDDSDDPDALMDPLEDYPLPFTKVDESYFTDALFIGDSRLQGFGFWSGLPATYYCATGFALYKYDTEKVVQTENGKVPIFDAMPYDAFTKIYIKVGLNELGYGTEENFEKYYAQLIEQLREYEPRAVIYVHAILPVTAAKSASDKAHNNPNIEKRNESLEKFAKDQKAYFLDAGPALADLDGSLKPEMTSDGIHLKPEYMKIWREYLCEHAVLVNTTASAAPKAQEDKTQIGDTETVSENEDADIEGNDEEENEDEE